MSEITHFINGQIVKGNSIRRQDVFNPATGNADKTVILAGENDVDDAVRAAKEAWPEWSKTPALRRARILDKFKNILWERLNHLAELFHRSMEKLSMMHWRITRGLEVVEFATAAPTLMKGEFSENVGSDVDSHMIRQSLGVCVGITPFNFPAMVPMWMFPIALATGNSFVLKPSERDPSASMLIAEWLKEAGLPDGVFNVIQGDKIAVDRLITHQDVKAISFVGSTPIANHIYTTGQQRGNEFKH